MNTITTEDLGLSKEQQEELVRGARIAFGGHEPDEVLTEPSLPEDTKE